MNVVTTRALAKAYGRKRVVDTLNMQVEAGDIYGFVGRNGAGKSTTMKMIAGLVEPTAGEIELFGSADNAPRAGGFSTSCSRIGALIEEPGVLPKLSAFDNLMVKALAMGVLRPAERCRDLLGLVGLADTGSQKVKGFSLGMRQRLGLALALTGTPDLLLLDEPFNGMDPEATRAMRNALVQVNRERGVTIVISSHVLDQLDRMATRYGVIRAGSLVSEFTEGELHERCGSSVRVRTADPSRALAVLEERLPGASFRAEPDGALSIFPADGYGRADIGSEGEDADAARTGAPTVERVSRILHHADQTILELYVVERDIEDYFVELMGGGGEDADAGGAPGVPDRSARKGR